MKILLIGTGALGSYYGLKIAYHGGDITFFSRGKAYQSIKEKGLAIDSSIEEPIQKSVKIIDALPVPAEFDLVIISTKSYDVKPLVDRLPDSLLSSSYFMTLQNGVLSEEIFLQKIKPERLLPATAFIGVSKIEPNIVLHSGGGRFQFGSYKQDERKGFLDDLCKVFEKSHIDLHFTENIMKVKWGKLVWNASYNPISTITRTKLGDLLSTPYGVQILRDSMRETVNVAKKAGYEFNEEFIDKQIDLPKNLYSFKTSMLQDFLSGKPLEIEAMLVNVIEKGKQVGVPTPTLSYLNSMLQILIYSRDIPKVF